MASKLLSAIYYDPSNEASFGGVEKLLRRARKKDPSITRKDVEDWLRGELTYTLHKPVRRKFLRNPIVVSHIDEQWQADLVEMREFSSQNKSINYILTVVDILSKYAWVVPLKDKTANSHKVAFQSIFKQRKPSKLQTDQGKEFVNSVDQKYLEDEEVHFFTAKNEDTKCSIVERFNRTLKSKMFKYFTSKGTRKYIDVLQKLVDSYNNSVHSSTKFKPVSVSADNEKTVFQNLYKVKDYREYLMLKSSKSKVVPEDKVRVRYKPSTFDKGYYPNWTDEIFDVEKVIKDKHKSFYKLKDHNNESLNRRFYPEEIQKVRENLYRVEKIIRRRKKGNTVEYLVKWLNHPHSENSWIPADDVVNL